MNCGSEWHKWDLHIHTDASDGKGTCQEILEEARKKGISCIAVTDHHTVCNVDKMKELAKPLGITVISGVEFRTEYGKTSVHMIGLFPDEHNGIRLTSKFLEENVLNQLGITRTNIIEKGKEQKRYKGDEDALFKVGMFLVQVDFKDAANFIHKYGGLVTVHAGKKGNGIETEMRHYGTGPHNTSIEDSLGPVKMELFNEGYVDICEVSNSKDVKHYLEEFGKPSILASDAHNLNDVGSKPCWIKANLTFEGLRQITAEPERVCFDEPTLLQRIKKNPDKFIKSIDVKRIDNATMDEVWFDDFHINFNPGLVAIIGNKGSGKSALTDILALCADTKNDAYSFLTPNKFRMPKPYNRSKQIEANIVWADNSYSPKKILDEPSDINQPERVKYIPQNFLENLCTTENDKQFEEELKKIIFQYLNPAQRYGKNDLDSLIQYLTAENVQYCKDIQDKIRGINSSIIIKEDMLEHEYKTKIENELKYKQKQLSNAQSAKPIEIKKPDLIEDKESQVAKIQLENLQKDLSEIDLQIKQKQEEQTRIFKQIQDLSAVEEKLNRLDEQVRDTLKDVSLVFVANGIQIHDIIKFEYTSQILKTKIQTLIDNNEKIKNLLDDNMEGSFISQKNIKQKTIDDLTQKLSEPEIKYQNYLAQKQEWEKSIEDIIGTEEKEGSIKNLQAKIDYIEHRLPEELKKLKTERKQKVKELIQKKSEVLEVYKKLFAPLVNFIDDYREALQDYPIVFDATFSIRNFENNFFNYISHQAVGSFYGKEQGSLRIKEIIDNIDFSDPNSIIKFPLEINENLQYDKREGNNNAPRNINNQLKDGFNKQGLFDYIYSLDYIEPYFQLKMNGKMLPSLSPGERGALLLLLYLFVDMDDKPLIIDQPEENLDNESVYKYIVHFIKEAKKHRQIIMVTHNPNLAVVCDADQIIQMKIDKQRDNTVSYESGAIEDPHINKIIVDILEGTYPAFHNRDSKYFDKTF